MPLPFTSGLAPFGAAIEFGGKIVLGGRFGTVGHQRAVNVVRWNGSGFEPFGELPGTPTSFCIWRDRLYATIVTFEGRGNVWRWDDTRWSQVVTFDDARCRLIVHDDEIVLFGDIF